MSRDCSDIQATVVEFEGDVSNLDGLDRQHLEHCAACRERVHDESALARILKSARPPADPHLQARIISALEKSAARRRWLASLPVAASVVLVLVGMTVLGGIPGSALVAEAVSQSSNSWIALAESAVVSLGGLAALSRVASELLPLSIRILSVLASLLGFIAIAGLTRRWNRLPAWSVRS